MVIEPVLIQKKVTVVEDEPTIDPVNPAPVVPLSLPEEQEETVIEPEPIQQEETVVQEPIVKKKTVFKPLVSKKT